MISKNARHLWEVTKKVQERTGDALVMMGPVRKAANLSHAAFDAAALELFEHDLYSLQLHDLPSSMTEAAREASIKRTYKGQTNYFHATAVRGSLPNEGSVSALQGRIIVAATAIGGGPGKRVRLADLRARLINVSRSDLDRALLALQEKGELLLMKNDNRSELRNEDHAAALDIMGAPRHLLYIEGRQQATTTPKKRASAPKKSPAKSTTGLCPVKAYMRKCPKKGS